MKKTALIGLAALILAFAAPSVQAQCSGFFCAIGNCPWYNHVADNTFSNGCSNWEYWGTAGVTTSNTMCQWYGNQVGYLGAAGGTIAQAFFTSSSYGDVYWFEYFIETTNMQPGDAVDVYIVDAQTYPPQWHHVDTITSDISCAKKEHEFLNPGWQGHFMQIRFLGSFASPSTFAYIDHVAFWQRTY